MAEAVYTPDREAFRPTELARGPWSPDAQHGGAPAGLLAWALERELQGHRQSVTRMSIDLLRPVGLEPLMVSVRGSTGRTVGRWDATLEAQGRPLARAVALSCTARELHAHAPARAGRLPFPDHDSQLRIAGMLDHRSFHYTAMQTRLAEGSVAQPGPAAVWFRLRYPLVAGQPVSPLMRAVTAADFGNGISWELRLEDYPCVSADLTVHLHRPPCGEWIGVAAQTTIEPHGVGLTDSVLHDLDGPIGRALQTLIVSAPAPRDRCF